MASPELSFFPPSEDDLIEAARELLIRKGHLPGPSPAGQREPAGETERDPAALSAESAARVEAAIKKGLSASAEGEDTSTERIMATRPGFIPSEEIPDLQKSYAALFKQAMSGMEKQEKGIERQMRDYEGYSQMVPRTDLSPLYRLQDAWFGTNMAKDYKAPPTAREQMAENLKRLNEIQGQRTKYTASELAGLRALIGGQMGGQTLMTTRQRETIGPPKPPPGQGAAASAQKSLSDAYRKDLIKVDQKYQKPSNALNKVYTLIDPEKHGTLGDLKAMAGPLARVMGEDVGAMSNKDLARQVEETLDTLIMEVSQFATGDMQKAPGKVLANIENRIRSVSALIDQDRKQALESLRETTQRTHKSSWHPGLDAATDILKSHSVIPKAAAPAPAKMISREEFGALAPEAKRKYLDSLKKGKGK